ncbi:MAG: hypothetical protein ACPG31_07075 [Planctomycetota bacterium]
MFLFGLAWGPTQDPVSEVHVQRVQQLLQEPRPEDPRWLATLFQSLTRLEHGPQELVYEGWRWMAAEKTDSAQSNFILYCRRQGLPLPKGTVIEAADSELERSLALWAVGELDACREALEKGALAYPDDSRYRTNLDWLSMDRPPQVAANANARDLAQAVLASRRAHP